jgi:hypothetical protein
MIRTGIVRDYWVVVVHLPDGKTVEKRVQGARRQAEEVACSIIDKWREKNRPQAG